MSLIIYPKVFNLSGWIVSTKITREMVHAKKEEWWVGVADLREKKLYMGRSGVDISYVPL
jgi:hypothetical protein